MYFFEFYCLVLSWSTVWPELAPCNSQLKGKSDNWVGCSSLLICAHLPAKWNCCRKLNYFCVSGVGKCCLYYGFWQQLNLLFTSLHWKNPQIHCRERTTVFSLVWCASGELQIGSAWYCSDSREHENWCQSDSVKANAFAYLSISHLFWRVGGYPLFRQVNNIFKGCSFGRMLQPSVNCWFVRIHCKKRWASLRASGAQSHQDGSCGACSAFQWSWSRGRRTKCTDREEDKEKMPISV